MANRENIRIKTKYHSVIECRENCVDGIGFKILAKSWSNKLFGIFNDKDEFQISSEAKGAALFVFEGRIVEREDGIYLEGDIHVKQSSKRIVYAGFFFSVIVALFLMTTFNPVFMFMSVLFLIVSGINYRYMNKSDDLYKLIVKRVS